MGKKRNPEYMHYHCSSKYLSKTDSVKVFILPCIFLLAEGGERSSRFQALVEKNHFTTSVAPLFVLYFFDIMLKMFI